MSFSVAKADALGSQAITQASPQQSLGQADFLKLMTTQLQSQDPFKPMDSAQFLGQIAQFSTVSGIQSLNTGFASLSDSLTANQALQGAALVGRSVQVPGDALRLGDAGTLTASATIPASGSVNATVRDSAGAVVRQIALGPQSAGDVDVSWDGLTDRGTRAPAGGYRLSVEVIGSDGRTQAAATQVIAPVTAVRLGAQGLQVEVAGVGQVPLTAVTQIR